MKTHKNALLKQSPIIRLWVKTKVGKPDFGSKVIDGHAECKDIPKSKNLTMAKTCIARPKSENQTIDKSQSPIFPWWDFPMVGKSNRINNTNSFNNTNYLIRGKKNTKI